MTLARRMMYKIVALALSLSLFGGAAVWGLRSSQVAVRIARDEYLELRMVLDIDEHLVAARGLLAKGGARQEVIDELAVANRRIHEFRVFQDTQPRDIEEHEEEESLLLQPVLANLEEVIDRLSEPSDTIAAEPAGEAIARVDRGRNTLKMLAAELDETIASANDRSSRTLFMSLALLAGLLVLIIVATTAINTAQYRSVVRPLRRIRDSVREIAAGRFSQRLAAVGDREFVELADEFNGMAAQLDELYRDLENKVREKSTELARSERLASVGYLASGVAHEISNPLNIISGYAELTLKQARKEAASAETLQALRIIRDESFRCKEIIEKLLSLPARCDKLRERISLGQLADEVAAMMSTLEQADGRDIRVDCADAARLEVLGNETELKQVFLNLMINALNAVEPGVGVVRIRGARDNGFVELRVSDNGRGMDPDTLEHVFEPFFTTHRGAEGRGIGLGLSITHAIIESHGGTITAASGGPGKGSTFTIRLPGLDDEPGIQTK